MAEALLQIDISAIQDNWRSLNKQSDAGVETGATVKANGYGLGIEQVATCLRDAGARTFFVAQAEEGSTARKALADNSAIYVLGGHMQGDADQLKAHQLIPVLNSSEQFRRHMRLCPDHPFGLQLDTGMNRLGMEPHEFADVLEQAMQAGPNLVMSHLACAEEPGNALNDQQLRCFTELTGGLNVTRSLAATGGILLGTEYHFNLTRPGIGLFGCFPFVEAKPVVRADIPVIQTRIVNTGEVVGYGGEWTASCQRKVATISAGYADGIFRMLGNRAVLCANGTACPIVGRISMDLITVDVTDLSEEVDYLQLLGDSQTVDQLAHEAGTIGHEVLTSLGRRYRRRYVHSK